MKDASPTPSHVNYDLWLGPAKQRRFNRNRFHGYWNWYRDYGNGDIGGDGVHQLDLARFLLDIDVPKSAAGHGGNYVFDDDSETPDTASCTYDYGDFLMTFEETQWPKYMLKTSGEIRNTDTFPEWPRNSIARRFKGTFWSASARWKNSAICRWNAYIPVSCGASKRPRSSDISQKTPTK